MAPATVQPLEHASTGRVHVRSLRSEDYQHLSRLEREVWSDDPVGSLCPYYLRLCTEHYPEWSFIAFDGERPVGYVLNFPKGKVNYCATLAVHPEYQKSRAIYLLIRAMVAKLFDEGMEECRFVVEPDNHEARRIHESLGARVVADVPDYYYMGDQRLISVIAREDLERLRARYAKLRLVS